MTTAYSTLLGLALPVQGELSGTWGDTVDNGITRYLDIAVAGTVTLTGDGAVTMSLTNGDATATNIVSSLTGAGTVSAQFAIIRVTGTLTVAKVLTAPSSSRTYVVVNAATGSTVTVKASGQTGISVAVGETAFVYFNGTDYVKVAGTTAGTGSVTSVAASVPSVFSIAGSPITTSGTLAITYSGTALPIANGGTGTTSTTFTNLTTNVTGTLPIANGGTGATTLAGANIAVTNAAQTFTGGQRGAVTALTSTSNSIAIDLATNCNFSYTTTQNSTLAAPSNPVAGQSGVIIITQGATPYTLAYNTFYKFAGGTVPTLTATASAVDTFAYYVESATRATCQLIKDVK
jgi:hypothetical protein